ncbi:MAG: segregation and condensation protein A [Frankiaceae bacterium]
MLALSEGPPFAVHLDNFEGPFDLLLGLIAKHKLDVTEVALARVTDELLAHVKALVAEGSAFPLGQASEFLVVAATLLDLKAARLLPRGEVDDEEDLALLEARDLLFARLLQYRAYKAVSALFSELADAESRHVPRTVPLEERFARALPELQLAITPVALAALAHRLREPAPPPQVATDHVHAPRVDVREHARVVAERLRERGVTTFRVLCVGCRQTLEVVARFLALLELYREGRVAFEQATPLGELTVRWVGERVHFEPHLEPNVEPEPGSRAG